MLTSLTFVLAGLALWLHESLLDTDAFTESVSEVFAIEAFTDSLGEFLTAQIFLALNIEGRVEARLSAADDLVEEWVLGLIDVGQRIEDRLGDIDRPRFADLTEPLVDAAEGAVENATREYLASQEFRQRLEGIIRSAHTAAVALLREDYEELPNVVVDERSVRIDLTPAIARIVQQAVANGLDFIGLEPSPALSARIGSAGEARTWMSDTLGFDPPADYGQVTIMQADRLETLQSGIRWFDRLVWLMVILVVVFAAGAVWLSPRKVRAALQLGLGIALATIAGGLIIDRLRNAVVAAFGSPAGREAALEVLNRSLAVLHTLEVVVVACALALALVSLAFELNWHRGMIRRKPENY